MDHTMEGDLVQEIDGLETAQDFLEFFDVSYDSGFVERKHIQLLRLFQQSCPVRTGVIAIAPTSRRYVLLINNLSWGVNWLWLVVVAKVVHPVMIERSES